MGSKSGSVIDKYGGKYKLRVDYSNSDGAISYNPIGVITSDFNDSYYCYMQYRNAEGKWTPSTPDKSNSKHKKKGEVKYIAKSAMYQGRINVRIKFGTNGSWSEVNFTPPTTPKPSKIEASVETNTYAKIHVTGSSGVANPVQKLVLERSNDGETGWTEVQTVNVSLSANAYDEYISDNGIEEGNRYYWRVKATNVNLVDSAYIMTGPYYTGANSSEVTNVNATITGNVATITWNCSTSSIENRTITSFQVMRETNGSGVYLQVGEVTAVEGTSSYSYEDTVATGSTYNYKVRAINKENEEQDDTGSGGTPSTEVETAPNAPDSVTAYRNGSDYIVLTIVGESSNATNVEIDRNIDGLGWNNVHSASYPLSTWTDENATASDNIVYRVRYTNSTGNSVYTYTDTVQIRQKPSTPLPSSPISGSPFDMSVGTVRLIWVHRPLDGSPQTAAILQYKVNSGSWTSVNVTTNPYYDLSLTGMSANDVITWKVCTKGSHADYSDYSTESTLTLQTKPTLAFTSPQNASVISTLPLVLSFNYNDTCGQLKELTVDITLANKTVKTVSIDVGQGTSGTYTYSLAGFLFDNNKTYGLKAHALSTSGLTADDSISVVIAYSEQTKPGALIPIVDTDSETGYAYFTALRDKTLIPIQLVNTNTTTVTVTSGHKYRFLDTTNETDTILTSDGEAFAVVGGEDMVIELTQMYGAGNEPATVDAFKEDYPNDYYSYSASTSPTPVSISAAYLYRVHDGETELVSTVTEGLQILDKYAPINIEYEYKLLMHTTGGQVLIVPTSVINSSPYWFCYFGNQIAKAKWNPEGSVKLSRPQRTEVRYSGRRYPVSYDQDAVEETFDFSTTFTEREDLNQFRQMIRRGGTGIWKSGDGDVYDANFEFSYSADYKLNNLIWNASLSVTRIDGGE